MNRENVLLRVATIFALTVLGFVLLAAASAEATPIKPNLDQLLEEAQRPEVPYIPARAGWNGPEVTKSAQVNMANTNVIELLSNAAEARAMRRIALAVAVPDPRVFLAFGAVIILLRKMRSLREQMGVPISQPA